MKQNPKRYAKFSFYGLGTKFYILTEKKLSSDVQNEIILLVKEFEENYSRFKLDSRLSQLNSQKLLKNPSPEMTNMLKFAIETYKLTNGLFNISIGSKLENQGYGIQNDKSSRISDNLVNEIEITADLITISKHMRLDFGGFGKGWFIDKLANFLVEKGTENYMINGGGDIKVGNKPMEIYIENPSNNNEYIGKMLLANRAFAASSNIKRVWAGVGNNEKHSHIQRPDGAPLISQVQMSCTSADSALKADVMATCLLLDPSAEQIKQILKWGDYCLVLQNNKILRTKNFNIF